MILNVHAGHNPSGKIGCGAVGIIEESVENRKVKDLVIAKLRALGHTVYDCTVDNGSSQNDVLSKIVKKCNEHKVDLDVSIHFNSGRNDYAGDGSIGGTEVRIYTGGGADTYAKRICEEIAGLGFRNRGVKQTKTLYVLKETKATALLVECCFVDDRDDVKLYNAEKMASAIVKGITGQVASSKPAQTTQAMPQAQPTQQATTSKTYYPRYTGNSGSIVDALKAVGIDSSFTSRNKIASMNGISGYAGNASQNATLLSLLKEGKLVKGTTTVQATSKPSVNYYPRYTGGSASLVDALKAVGIDSSFGTRSKIAKANGISAYSGTAGQNSTILSLLKQGKLVKA